MAKKGSSQGAPEEDKLTGGCAKGAVIYAQGISLESGANRGREAEALKMEAMS